MKPKTASYYKQNRLKQPRAFYCATKTGSISRAAEQLYLSQPSVFLHIQALERKLNTMPCKRCGPKIRLTPDGRALLEIVQPMVDAMDSLAKRFIELLAADYFHRSGGPNHAEFPACLKSICNAGRDNAGGREHDDGQ